MAYYSIIDLGSNSIRLLIYEVDEGATAPFSKKDFRSVINTAKIAGLSAYVQNGVFTKAGVNKAVEVLSEHLRRASHFNCVDTRIFATAVLRNCTNSEEAVAAISAKIGQPIDVLSAYEEAHFGFIGASCDRTIESGTLIDIGGGSTELTVIKDGADSHGVSIGQGTVSSYAQFVDMILPKTEEMYALEDAFAAKLDELGDLAPYQTGRLYGIGGAVRAAAKMYGAAYMEGVRPKTLELHQMDAILTLLARDPQTFAHIAVKATPDRLHTLVPGCLIIITLMRKLGIKTIEICKYGVREGYLIKRVLTPCHSEER